MSLRITNPDSTQMALLDPYMTTPLLFMSLLRMLSEWIGTSAYLEIRLHGVLDGSTSIQQVNSYFVSHFKSILLANEWVTVEMEKGNSKKQTRVFVHQMVCLLITEFQSHLITGNQVGA